MSETEQVWSRLSGVFHKIFREPGLILSPQTSSWDVKGWDSIANLQLILDVEKEFQVQFSTHEVLSLEKIGDLHSLVLAKLKTS